MERTHEWVMFRPDKQKNVGHFYNNEFGLWTLESVQKRSFFKEAKNLLILTILVRFNFARLVIFLDLFVRNECF